MNDGKLYEELIYRYILSTSYEINDDCEFRVFYNIESNVRIEDKRTGQQRQIDLLASSPSNNKLYIIECKNWDTPVDAPEVESFIQKCENLYANQCIMFSSSGFTQPALILGNKSRGLHLKTLPIEQLMQYLSPYYETNHLYFSCPKCKSNNGFFNSEIGTIECDEVMHIVSNNGLYFKAYLGTCNICFNMYIFTSKTNTINQLYTFVNSNDIQYIPTEKEIITSNNNNTVIYQIDTFGNFKNIFLNNVPCSIIERYKY
ncbi:restriction endonuclease [Hungatella hathewayi]|uniref:restriction endonuclease n=1 Tax=Hungatella hathewayi TaxID=154046 RepID=UPI00356A7BA3